jgi:hypothetical protein
MPFGIGSRRTVTPADVLAARATEAMDALVAAADTPYRRERDLPCVLPIGPAEIADVSPAARRRILGRLASALRAERNRGRAGHWCYDLNRHIALAQVYESERRLLSGQPPPKIPWK